jgi:hypothetical protein
MKDLFIPYQQALALKELGFNKPCLTYYFSDGVFNDATEEDDTLYPGDPRFYSDTNSSLAKYLEDELKYKAIAAPLYQQAFGFFREKYGYCVTIKKCTPSEYKFEIEQLFAEGDNYYFIDFVFKSHKEAELACLEKLIEIVKTK